MRKIPSMLSGSIFAILCMGILPSADAEPPLHVERLNVALAEDLALQNDLTLQARRAALEVARLQMRMAWGIEDPELRVGYGENDSPSDDPLVSDRSSEDYSVALRLFPPNLWTLRGNRAAARSAVRAEESAVRLAEWQVVTRVRDLYARIVYFRREIDILQDLVDSQAHFRTSMKEMRSGGEATSLMSISAGLDYLDTIADRDEARQDLRLATSELEAITGVSALDEAEFQKGSRALGQHVQNLDLQSLQEMALEMRADVAILTWRLGMAAAGARVAQRQRLPWLSHVQLGYDEEQGDQEDQGWSIQAAVNLPIFSYATVGEEDVLEADANRLRAELLAVRERVRREVQVAWHTVRAALENEQEYMRDIDPLLIELQSALSAAEGESGIGIEMEMQVREGIAKSLRAKNLSEFSLSRAILDLEQSLGADLPR